MNRDRAIDLALVQVDAEMRVNLSRRWTPHQVQKLAERRIAYLMRKAFGILPECRYDPTIWR